MAFWLNHSNSLMMNHLPPDECPTFSTSQCSQTHSEMVMGITPPSVFVVVQLPMATHHPPAQHSSFMPCASAALKGLPEPWEGESGRAMAPATHGPPAKAAWMCLEALLQLQSDSRNNSAFPSLANYFLISHQHIFIGNFNQKTQKNPECRESTLQLFLHFMCYISCPSWLILLYLDTS